MSVIITENEVKLGEELARLIERVANESIAARGAFYLGVSGGSVVTFLSAGLPGISTDYSKWKIFFNDERVVPVNDPDSTFGAYMKDLVGKVELTAEQFVRMKEGVSADEAARDYIQKMELYFKGTLPTIDMLVLGVGPDGHTCSLFPGHKLLNETEIWVAPVVDSPKPPPERITITFPVINNARYCVFAMAGDSKADMVKRVLVDKEDFPVNLVKPKSGLVYWILDKKSAKHLKS